MTEHAWTEMKFTPVTVTLEGGELVVHTSEVSAEVAEEEKRIGCWLCDLPCNKETLNTECFPVAPPA